MINWYDAFMRAEVEYRRSRALPQPRPYDNGFLPVRNHRLRAFRRRTSRFATEKPAAVRARHTEPIVTKPIVTDPDHGTEVPDVVGR